ncbi:unnamed protein product, partial [Vitis vinifera]
MNLDLIVFCLINFILSLDFFSSLSFEMKGDRIFIVFWFFVPLLFKAVDELFL